MSYPRMLPSRITLVIFNAVTFQCLWLAAVAGSVKGWAWLAWVLLAFMFFLQGQGSGQWRRDGATLVAAGMLCLLLEPVWLLANVLSYREWQVSWLAPHWIWSLWLGLGLCLHYSLAWLQQRYCLAAFLGAFAAVGSVSMGVELGAAQAPQGWWVLAMVYGGVWALAVPLLTLAAEWLHQNLYRPYHSGGAHAG